MFANRYVRALTQPEQQLFNLLPEANSDAVRVKYAPAMPIAMTPAVQPVTPTATPLVPPISQKAASLGENPGVLPVGGRQAWTFSGSKGTLLIIEARADNPATGVLDPTEQVRRGLLDTFLTVWNPDGALIAQNDDFPSGKDTNARIDLVLPDNGPFTIEVRSAQDHTGGSYKLVITPVQLGTELSQVSFKDQQRGVWAVTLSSDGRYALSSLGPERSFYNVYNTGSMSLWDLVDPTHPREIRRFNESNAQHTMSVAAISFCPGDHAMISASWDQTMVTWNIDTGQPVQNLVGHWAAVWDLACLYGTNTAISSGFDGSLILWDLQTGKEIRRFQHGPKMYSSIYAVAVSPDNKTVLSASTDGWVKVWDVASGQQLRQFSQPAGATSVAFNSDGHTIASGDTDGNIVLWDINSGQIIRQLVGHRENNWVNDLNFSSDGRYLVSASFDGTVRLWDVATGRELVRFVGHTGPIWSAVISADNRLIVSAALDDTLRIWKIPAGIR